jgi:hypothetical protein
MLILLNKSIMRDCDFPFPVALSAFGVGFAAITSRLLLGSGLIRFTQPELCSDWRAYARSTLPIGALSALTLALGNSSYLHLSVAVCQMLKAVTPAIALALLVLLRIESPSRIEVACVLVITAGTCVATRGEITLSRLGLALQLGANFCEASRLVLLQRLLKNMKLPLMEMQYHVAPTQLLCLLTAAACIELGSAAERERAHASIMAHGGRFFAAGALGLLLQVVGLFAVKAAGSVAVKLLGIARGAGLVLFEVLKGSSGGETPPSSVQLAGYSASVGGFVLYTLVRLRAAADAAPAPPPARGPGRARTPPRRTRTPSRPATGASPRRARKKTQ